MGYHGAKIGSLMSERLAPQKSASFGFSKEICATGGFNAFAAIAIPTCLSQG
jgi:hypothetical protein